MHVGLAFTEIQFIKPGTCKNRPGGEVGREERVQNQTCYKNVDSFLCVNILTWLH